MLVIYITNFAEGILMVYGWQEYVLPCLLSLACAATVIKDVYQYN